MAFVRILYNLYAITIFIVLMLVILPAVFVASFFGRIRGGNMIYRLCSFWADCWFLLVGIRHRNYYEGIHNRHKQYIFIANHISYLDAPLIVKTLRQPVRPLGKVEMSRIPLFGFIYRNAIVTVDRSSPENRAKSVRVLKSILKRGISIFIFPEGTFNQTLQPLKDFYDGAFRIAIETQTSIKPVLFLDAYDRMHHHHILSITPGRSRSIILEEIPVNDYTIKDIQELKRKTFDLMEQKLLEYQASWVDHSGNINTIRP